MIEKECELCGRYFETPTKIRKYCDDCLKHFKKNSSDIAYSQRRSRTYSKPEVHDLICAICGTAFRAPLSLAWHADGKYFCSRKCKEEYKHSTATCHYCGKSIADVPTYDMADWHTWYCSDECKEKERWDLARKEGRVHKCLHCGKEFIRKEGTFCSKECYKAAVEDGWNPTPVEQGPKYLSRNVKCPVCGRGFVKKYLLPVSDEELSKPVVCSKTCALEMGRRIKRKRDVELKKAEEIYEKNRAEALKKQEEAEKKRNDLCATCKVPYNYCERMQSEFRIIPVGARYNKYGKLVACPKYKE